jgi:hypothetical protein
MKLLPMLLTITACAGTAGTACAEDDPYCRWELLGSVGMTGLPTGVYVPQGGDDCAVLPECMTACDMDPVQQLPFSGNPQVQLMRRYGSEATCSVQGLDAADTCEVGYDVGMKLVTSTSTPPDGNCPAMKSPTGVYWWCCL